MNLSIYIHIYIYIYIIIYIYAYIYIVILYICVCVFARICTCRAPTSWCDARGACARAWRAQTPYDVASLQDRILINISFEYLASLVLTCSRPYKIGVFLDAYGLEGCNTCTYLATRVCALRVEFLLERVNFGSDEAHHGMLSCASQLGQRLLASGVV